MSLKPEDLISKAEPEITAFKQNFKIADATDLVVEYNGEKLGFIDLVMEGGGVKGIATAGSVYALERLGFRFRKVAGTSAGAINAILLAAAGNHALEVKSDAVIKHLTSLDFYEFVDGGSDARALLNSLNVDSGNFFGRFFKRGKRALALTRNINDLFGSLGINPGESFREKISDILFELNKHQHFTCQELEKQLKAHIDVLPDTVQIKQDLICEFQLIVADISKQRKAVFPRDLHMYFKNPDGIHVSDLVRATMSIPIFFEPFTLEDFHTRASNWKSDTNITFVDGGVVSNFPLSLYDTKGNVRPKCPTFGLLIDETKGATNNYSRKDNEIDNLAELVMAMHQTMQVYGDKAYIDNHPGAEARIIRLSNWVDLNGKKYPIKTTDFDITSDEKIHLFLNGVKATLEKLKTWNFKQYIQKYRKP